MTASGARGRRRWMTVVVGCAVAAAAGILLYQSVHDPVDFAADLRWVRDLRAGINPYVPDPSRDLYPYLYPPHLAVFEYPFAAIGTPAAAAFLWALVKLAVLALAVVLAAGMIGKDYPGKNKKWLWIIPCVLLSSFIWSEFKLGQKNVFMASFLIVGIHLLERGNTAGSAFALSLSTIKAVPLLFVPYLAVKRQWAILAGCGAFLLLFYAALHFLSPLGVFPLIAEWGNRMRDLKGNLSAVAFHENASLFGMYARFLGPHPTQSVYLPYANLLALSDRTIVISVAATVCVLAAAMFAVFLTNGRVSGVVFHREVALVFVSILMFSPVTRSAHFVMLLFPYMALVQAVAAEDNWTGRLSLASLVTSGIAILLRSSDVVGWKIKEITECWSVFTLALVALWMSLLCLSWPRGAAGRAPARRARAAPPARG